jgi:uncharacterized repeat protein (TIGR03833 family)
MSHATHTPDDIRPCTTMNINRDGRIRNNISPGSVVMIVQKQDQSTGKSVEGKVQEILTSSSFHPHGIKVRLEDGRVGRIREICNHR